MSTVSISFVVQTKGNGFSELTLNAESLRKVMTMNIKEAERLESKMFRLAAATTALQGVTNSVSGIKKTLTDLTAESESFTQAMRAANTMAGRDESGFRQLREEVTELSHEIPVARDLLAKGLYQTISNGVPEDNWISFLEKSSRAAVGGMADLEKVVGVTSTVIKNYGMSWEEAGAIQDKIQLTAKNGVTSFEQLAQALPRVTGNAATLGVSIDELMATFATLTGVSGNTAEVSTQLAAIFTALVKPSSEAAKMAAEMGIQFDAATIKAAGGLQSFLIQLDQCVKEYAAASGTLEQEVYGKLFGSAEALRALVPLQGELASKFTENVAVMSESAGTIDGAFEQMSTGIEASIQKTINGLSEWSDRFADYMSRFIPPLDAAERFSSLAMSMTYLVMAMIRFHRFATFHVHFSKIATAASFLGIRTKNLAKAFIILGGQLRNSTISLRAFTAVFRLTGIGLAIYALSMAIDYLTGSLGSATDQLEEATDAMSQLEDGTEEYSRAAADAKVKIDGHIKSLRDLIQTQGDETKAVKQMNDEYGEMFGKKESAKEWYDTLIRNSERYVRQIGYEAQMRSLAFAQAQNEIDRQLAAERKAEWERNNRDKMRRGKRDIVTGTFNWYSKDEEWKELDKACTDLAQAGSELEKRINAVTGKMSELASTGAGSIKVTAELKIDEMTLKQVEDEIKSVTDDLKNTTDATRIRELRIEYERLVIRKNVLEKQTGLGTSSSRTSSSKTTQNNLPERPASLITLENYDQEIRYQETMRLKVSADQIAAYDQEIARLKQMRAEMERAAFIPLEPDQISTYAELDSDLEYWQELLKNTTGAERQAAQERINALEAVRRKWDEDLAAMKEPVSLVDANSIAALDEAIGILEAKIQRAGADEIAVYEKTRLAFERKRKALERGIEIPTMIQEAEEINELTGKEYRIKIRGIGFEELTEKIRQLQRMLNDVENPVTATQRKEIESLIETYRQWQRDSIDAFATVREGWSGIEGMGGGIQSITDALHGQRNAWEMTTGVINGALQVFDGVMKLVDIFKMLLGLSAVQVAANKTETASYAGLAAAKTIAAHAAIPFVGTSTAAAMIALQQTMIAAAGVPKFAQGGIVSGPTLALVGEYAGASSNPEIIAPLDRLQDIIAGSGNAAGGTVHVTGKFKLTGSDLVAAIANTTRIGSRSGRRSNINI